MLPKIQAEKNTQALEEAQAKVRQLKTTYDLKRAAADADLRILQIRRDRAENAMRQAESNADRMAIKSPIGGMAVLRSIWKSNNMAEVQEGEEVRSGMPIVDVVNPALDARAREGEPGGHRRAEARPRRSGSASTRIPTSPSPAGSARSRRWRSRRRYRPRCATSSP